MAEGILPQQVEMKPQIQAAVDAALGLCGSEIFIITLLTDMPFPVGMELGKWDSIGNALIRTTVGIYP